MSDKKTKKRTIVRDNNDGHFAAKEEAINHPESTTVETIDPIKGRTRTLIKEIDENPKNIYYKNEILVMLRSLLSK